MEVLASMHRMSATTFLSLTFLVKMAPDCSLNTTGPAITTAQEFFVTYCITFTFLLLFLVPFRVQLVDNLRKLLCFNIFTSVFMKIFCIWNIIIGLYQVAHQCGHSQAPTPKLKRDKCKLNYKPIQSAPPMDEYTTGIQMRSTLLLDDDSPLLTPKEVYKPTKQLKSLADTTSEGETLISQVTPLLGTTPSKIVKSNIGTHQMIFRIYWAQESIKGMLQTLDGIIINQPKWFLPLVEEAK